MKKIIQPIALFFLLFFLPFGSWYYLSSGFDYQKRVRAELKDYGKIPEFSFTSTTGQPFSNLQLKGKMAVATFGSPEESLSKYGFFDTLEKLHEQFDARDDLLFLTHILSEKEQLPAYLEQHALKDTSQCILLRGEEEQFTQLALQGYKMPLETLTVSQNPYLVLVDTSGTIKNYYDMRDMKQIKNLVEHIAMILPRRGSEDPKLRRAREK